MYKPKFFFSSVQSLNAVKLKSNNTVPGKNKIT